MLLVLVIVKVEVVDIVVLAEFVIVMAVLIVEVVENDDVTETSYR